MKRPVFIVARVLLDLQGTGGRPTVFKIGADAAPLHVVGVCPVYDDRARAEVDFPGATIIHAELETSE